MVAQHYIPFSRQPGGAGAREPHLSCFRDFWQCRSISVFKQENRKTQIFVFERIVSNLLDLNLREVETF